MRTRPRPLLTDLLLPVLAAGAILILPGCNQPAGEPGPAEEVTAEAPMPGADAGTAAAATNAEAAETPKPGADSVTSAELPKPAEEPAAPAAATNAEVAPKLTVAEQLKAEFSRPGPGAGLPDWLRGNRVELHWEGPLLFAEEDGTPDKRFSPWLKNVQSRIKGMGPAVTVGLAKRGGEGSWWPSRVGETLPVARDRNLFKEFFLDPMDAAGIKYIAYYRHDIDKPMEALHPDWLSLGADGKPLQNMDRDQTAHRFCFNSPFRDFVKTRLVELAEQGTPGVYFDQDHMNEVCTCEFCKAKFLAVRGYPMPENLRPYTPEFLDVAKFVGDTISSTFAEWREAVKKVKPDMVFITGADELADFMGVHHAESLPDSTDVLKGEFQKCFGGQQHFPASPLRKLLRSNPDYYEPTRAQQESLDWILMRDAGGGRPAHIWNFYPDKEFGETFHTSMALVAHGNISSTTVEVMAKEHSYRELFTLGKLLGNELTEARPYGWAALYVSSAIKEQAYPADGDAATSYRQRFERLYAPALATADALQKAHYPFVTLLDRDVRAGRVSPMTQVIVVPSADLLPPDLQDSLSKLEAQGISVIRLSSKDGWYLAASVPSLQENLMKEITAKAGLPPIQVEGPADVRTNYFLDHGGKGILVSAVRDWNNFWFFGKDRSKRRALLPEQEPVAGMKLVVRDPAFGVESAKVVDFKESPAVEITENGTVLNLPPFPIYQFLQADFKQ